MDEKPELVKDTFEEDDKRALARHKKEVAIAEIEGNFQRMGLGTSAQDKQIKTWILNQVFKCVSVDKLIDFPSEQVEHGQEVVSLFADKYIEYMNDCRANQGSPNQEEVKDLMKQAKEMLEL